jgi:SAM-dependent methyltransferase
MRISAPKKSAKVNLTIRDGRVFIKGATYMGPADEDEVDRLNEQHFMLRHVVGQNYVAPLDAIPIHDVLDMGTGTGIWVLEMAHEFPTANFVGIDINNVNQPTTVLPNNVQFQLGDVLKGIDYPNSSFDYIHARLLVGGIPRAGWSNTLLEYHRMLRPGGFLELIEPDMLVRNPGPVGLQLVNRIPQFLQEAHGVDPSIFSDTMTRMLRTSGFNPVNMVPLELPIGKWGGVTGEMQLRNYLGIVRIFKAPMIRAGIFENDDWVEQKLQEWIHEVNTNQSYMHLYYYVGRKPLQ